MFIVMLASECAPVAKAGGPGDAYNPRATNFVKGALVYSNFTTASPRHARGYGLDYAMRNPATDPLP